MVGNWVSEGREETHTLSSCLSPWGWTTAHVNIERAQVVGLPCDQLVSWGIVNSGGVYAVMDWIAYAQNWYVKVLFLIVIVFRHKAHKKVIKVKWVHKGGTLIQ